MAENEDQAQRGDWRCFSDCATLLPAMAERAFIILKYVNKTPALASCAKCHRKFFTPNTYYNDPPGADEYLRTKFDWHDCPEEPRIGPGWPER